MIRQAQYSRFGPADEVLEIIQAAKPAPGDGEVLVRLHASGINPSDVKKRAGWGNTVPPVHPVVPHADGAGIVEAVGKGVDPNWLGRRVWIFNAQGSAGYGLRDGPEVGTAADWAALPTGCIAALPETASFETGACLGVPAITAHYAVFSDGPVDGMTLLVQGGAGAVGELAIQFAVAAGARVLTTVSSFDKAAIARRAGAEQTFNRHDSDMATAIRSAAPDGIDRIVEVDFGANAALNAKILKVGGHIAAYSSPSNRHPAMPYYELQMRAAQIRLISNVLIPRPAIEAAITGINDALSQNRLRPTISAIHPLEQIAVAHERVESGKGIGKTVLTIAAGD